MRHSFLLLLVACSSPHHGSAAPPKPVTPPVVPVPVATTSCSDVGTLLRGTDDTLRPEREAVIARSCLLDHWSESTINCVAAEAQPQGCLKFLSAEQRAGYDRRIAELESTAPTAKPPVAINRSTKCDDGVGNVEEYLPALSSAVMGSVQDRNLAINVRRRAIVKSCEATSWAQDAKGCFEDENESTAECRAYLDEPQEQALAAAIAATDKLETKILAAEKKPNTITCDVTIKTHYSERAWTQKAPNLKGPARTKLAEDMRKRMLFSCTNDRWSAAERACIVVGGGDACPHVSDWGFGVIARPSTGIPACDTYSAAIDAMVSCAKIPESTRTALRDSWEQVLKANRSDAPPDVKKSISDACMAGDDAARQALVNVGCRLTQ